MNMKKILAFLTLLCIMAMKPADKKKILFFGDSITQMGINKGGYIDQLQQHLIEQKINDLYELIGAGVGGNKVYDLYLRIEEDVLDKHPDIVLIYVGINDVWHKTSGIGTDIEKFGKFYTAIIKKLQAAGIQVVLCTPSVIGEKKKNANPQDADLNAYSEVIRKLAVTMQCKLVDLRKAFSNWEETNNAADLEQGLLTTDRVHLTNTGNELVAAEMLKVLQLN